MDKKRGAINSITSIVLRVISVILNFFALRALVQMMGVDYQGFNTLFNSILGVLTIVEVGFAGAVGFCLYDPILAGDKEKIAAYNCYLKRIYLIIGVIVILTGAAVGIFLPYLANGATVTWDIYLAYFSYLLGSGGVYFFSYKGVLLNAYKENFKKDFASSSASIIQHILQIIFAYIFPNFLLFSSFTLVNLLIQFLLITVFSKEHKDVFKGNVSLSLVEKRELYKLVRGGLYHRITGIAANSLDTIIISSLISVTALGHYANYNTIATALVTVIGAGISATISVLGHAYRSQGKEALKRYFNITILGGFILFSVVYGGYAAASTPFVAMFYGEKYIESWPIVLAISCLGFIHLFAYLPAAFRDCSGLFKKDALVPILSLVVQIILKFSLVWNFGILGVVWSNVAVYACINIPGTTYYLYKNIFQSKFDKTCLLMLFMPLLFLAELAFILWITKYIQGSYTMLFFVNGFIAVGIAGICSISFAFFGKDFRTFTLSTAKRLLKRN